MVLWMDSYSQRIKKCIVTMDMVVTRCWSPSNTTWSWPFSIALLCVQRPNSQAASPQMSLRRTQAWPTPGGLHCCPSPKDTMIRGRGNYNNEDNELRSPKTIHLVKIGEQNLSRSMTTNGWNTMKWAVNTLCNGLRKIYFLLIFKIYVCIIKQFHIKNFNACFTVYISDLWA